MAKTKHPEGPIRILFDAATSEFFWVGTTDQGNLVVVDDSSYSNEAYALDAAAEAQGISRDELVRASVNPSPDEVAAEEEVVVEKKAGKGDRKAPV